MSILSHNPAYERDHAPAVSVAFVFPDQTAPSLAASVDEFRAVDMRGGADFAAIAELTSGPVVFCVDELAELDAAMADRRATALAQRTEIHVGLDDERLAELAGHDRTAVRA